MFLSEDNDKRAAKASELFSAARRIHCSSRQISLFLHHRNALSPGSGKRPFRAEEPSDLNRYSCWIPTFNFNIISTFYSLGGRAMADFYPLLSRAIARLGINDTHERQKVYDQARNILAEQMRRLQPFASASEMLYEQTALEGAITRLEELFDPTCQTATNSNSTWGVAIEETCETTSGPIEARPDIIAAIARTPSRPRSGMKSALFVSESVPDFHDIDQPMARAISKLGHDSNVGLKSQFTGSVSRRESHMNAEGRAVPDTSLDVNARTKPTTLLVVGTALTAAITAFVTIICVPLLLVDISRLVWLSEHLFDNPLPLVFAAAVFSFMILLLLPIFQARRRKAAINSLWRSLGLDNRRA